ncbi:MAG: hypothetical protein F4029_17140 [Gammaproteobacteria bacterium]|nr:hypothetical protein [Gammaproteobacteria bacterium]MYF27335.1 hypothetical protein [Gammaproteobacteria bacterium]MYK47944.1 hypothetical protein [Gammaproteobacteria bacterium]
MAEIFILLLFLILLAFLALAQSWERKRESETAAAQELRDELVALEEWRPVTEEFETPDEVVTLKRDKERAEQAAERHRRQNEALRDVLAKEDGGAAEAVRVAQEAERRAEEAMEELRVFRAKGHNPPCWYRVVPRADGDGTREKPYYSFNLGVFDDAIVVRRAVTPPGGAADDNGGSFAGEAERLGFGAIPYDVRLTDAQVVRHLNPIHEAGKSKRVRSYSCVFWVRVWDLTSRHAKARWQQAHDKLIEGMFGAYTVRSDPWPEPITIDGG